MSKVFLSVLNLSLMASIAIFCVILLRALFNKMRCPKRFSVYLWLIPLVRLIVPVDINADFSIVPDFETSVQWEAAEETYIEVPKESVEPVAEMDGDFAVKASENEKKPAIESDNAYGIGGIWIHGSGIDTALSICSLIWLSGAVIFILHGLISYIILRSELRKCTIMTESTEVSGSNRASANRFHFKNVHFVKKLPTAFVLGVFKPEVYIPEDIGENAKKYVLDHENMHIRKCDHIYKVTAYIVTRVYWFNPVVWLFFNLLKKDIEFACDESVIADEKTEYKKGYALALLQLSINERVIEAPLSFSEGGVSKRIKHIVSYKKPDKLHVLLMLCIAIAACCCLLTNRPVKADKLNKTDELIADITNDSDHSRKAGADVFLKNITDGRVQYYKMLEQGDTEPDLYKMMPELHIDGSRFDLQFKKFSSYAGAGEFTISGNIMTASTNDGLYIFVFTVTDEGNLVFDAEESRKASSETDFGDLYDGAVFMPVFSAIRIKEADYEKKVRNTNFIFGYIWDFAE